MPIDRQKTKIIATLGNPEGPKGGTYPCGVYNLQLEKLKDATLQDIIVLLLDHSVDLIRVNLAHIDLNHLPAQFATIKAAVLEAEKHRPRVGVLADLPGPKIRFRSGEWLLPTETLRIHFDKDRKEDLVLASQAQQEAPKESTARIRLDDKAFAEAYSKAADSILEEVEKKTQPGSPDLLAFIGDNDATLIVKRVEGRELICKIVAVANDERKIGNRKGFTIRGISKPIDAFTNQDKAKLSTLLRADYDAPGPPILSHVGISFCQRREDARQVLYHITKEIKQLQRTSDLSDLLVRAPLVIAKIETDEGVKNIDAILDFADGAMIARGDLALEVEMTELPEKSKHVISRCNLRGKPAIMATQMLGSMESNIECSRPEATDVFNAVVDGADGLMLSGETCSGMYPAHAILKMQQLAKRAEDYVERQVSEDRQIEDRFNKLEVISRRVQEWEGRYDRILSGYLNKEGLSDDEFTFISKLTRIKSQRLAKQNSTDRVSHAACIMSADPEVKAIVATTTSGRTARMLARFRPRVWVHAQPHSDLVARKLAIVWGVMVGEILPVEARAGDSAWLIDRSREAIGRDKSLAKAPVIFTCGIPLGEVGTTNLIQKWDPAPT
jgi:pyruvate kinase